MNRNYKAIAAMSLNRVIGNGNKIPWHISEDFKWFKSQTLNQIIVMGRKTFESIGKPLPKREHIVLSRQTIPFPDTRLINSLEELEKIETDKEIWICGGAEIYKIALPYCSDLYLTTVKREVQGDAFFPPFEELFEFDTIIRDEKEFKIEHYRAK